jgi:hypothetical protein
MPMAAWMTSASTSAHPAHHRWSATTEDIGGLAWQAMCVHAGHCVCHVPERGAYKAACRLHSRAHHAYTQLVLNVGSLEDCLQAATTLIDKHACHATTSLTVGPSRLPAGSHCNCNAGQPIHNRLDVGPSWLPASAVSGECVQLPCGCCPGG